MAIAECDKPVYSKTYRNHTNSSFKKLTEMEKKQTTMLSMIHRLKHKARILDDLKYITNKVVSNCAYHNKNIEEQFKKFESLKVPNDEKEIISRAWELKFNLGKSLMKDLKELINYVESCNNS
ncbi:MAG: hypothetical protein MUO21_06980 [Nitrososphaeraceae archaeon]|nr:hypothetical protein [Nitrososphaeraceae archaeon]